MGVKSHKYMAILQNKSCVQNYRENISSAAVTEWDISFIQLFQGKGGPSTVMSILVNP